MKRNKPTVAIVDNDLSFLKALERLVLAFGYHAATYTSAELFLQSLSSANVDCLLLDINLDGISGLDLHRQLVTENKALPVIFISGRADIATLMQGHDVSAASYLQKPFESGSLQTALSLALCSVG
jgi:FixJ family two-component response regulator